MHDSDFDAYHKWLGIPPQQQPPDHYRLLGIERFENDGDVIAHAADARMAHVKTMASGKYGQLSQTLLNDIAAAQVCLLTRKTKAAYDAQLRSEQRRRKIFIGAALFLAAIGLMLTGGIIVAVQKRPVAVAVADARATSSPQAAPVAAALPSKPAEPPTSTAAQPVAAPAAPPAPAAKSPTEMPKPAPTEPPKPAPTAPPAPAAKSPTEPPRPAPTEPPKPAPTEPPKPAPTEPPRPAPTEPPKPAPTEMPKPAPAEPPKPAAAAPPAAEAKPAAKAPVPSPEAQAKMERDLAEFYHPDDADTPVKRLELAEKLYAKAEQTANDTAWRYVAARTAALLAGEAGRIDRAFEIVEQMRQWYDFDPTNAKVRVLAQAAKVATGTTGSVFVCRAIAEKAVKLAEELLRADAYDTAADLLEKVAGPTAKRSGEKELLASIGKQRDQIKRERAEYDLVQKAQWSVESRPEDAESQLVLGRWHCLLKQNWEKGLPHLAKGSDAALAELARRDLRGTNSAEAMAEIGDQWREQGERAAEDKKPVGVSALRARAAFWYQRALPGLTGIAKEKTEKRLAEMAAPAEDKTEYALSFNGWMSHAMVPFRYLGTCPITVEAIVKPVLEAPGSGTLLSNYDRVAGSGLMLACTNGVMAFHLAESQPSTTTPPPPGVLGSLSAAAPVKGDRFSHVAGVFDGRQMRLYVDGQLAGSRGVANPHKPTTKYPFVIGAAPQDMAKSGLLVDGFFKGQIKCLRISDVALYTDSFLPPAMLSREQNTQLLLSFTKRSGDTVNDTSGRKTSLSGPGGRKRSVTTSAKISGAAWVPAGSAPEPEKPPASPPPK